MRTTKTNIFSSSHPSLLHGANLHLLVVAATSSTFTFSAESFAQLFPSYSVGNSVTRFGEILAFWKKYPIVFGNFSKVVFGIWKYFEPVWAKNCHWAKFHYCCKWPNIKKIIYSSGHTGRESGKSISRPKQIKPWP